MAAFVESIIIGDGADFGAEASLTTNAIHTLDNPGSCNGVFFADTFTTNSNYTNSIGVFINSKLEGVSLDSFASLEIQPTGSAIPGALYGIKIDRPNFEAGNPSNQYGLFIDDQNLIPSNNYAIYTHAGDIRFGSLAGNGGVVMVKEDGTLYVAS